MIDKNVSLFNVVISHSTLDFCPFSLPINKVYPTFWFHLIKLHGTTDYYDGGEDYNSVESVIDFWINFNNTNTDPIINNINDNGTSITSYKYENGNNNVSVEHYKIIDGGHVWFSNDFNGKNTGQLIWDFVSKYDIDGLILD